MIDVYVTEFHPFYQVWVDGQVYDTFQARFGPPLTWAQQFDVASYYREALSAVQ
jgi:hypothetical protein